MSFKSDFLKLQNYWQQNKNEKHLSCHIPQTFINQSESLSSPWLDPMTQCKNAWA